MINPDYSIMDSLPAISMSSANEVTVGEFNRKHAKGSVLGIPGNVATTYVDTIDPQKVIKEARGDIHIDNVRAEAEVLSRLHDYGYDASIRVASMPREFGVPCEIGVGVVVGEEAHRVMNFLKKKIMEAHIVGVSVVDLKVDAILRDHTGKLSMIDYNGSVLLPEWTMISAVWKYRNKCVYNPNILSESWSNSLKVSPSQRKLIERSIENARTMLRSIVDGEIKPEAGYEILQSDTFLESKILEPILGRTLKRELRGILDREYKELPRFFGRRQVEDENARDRLERDKQVLTSIVGAADLIGVGKLPIVVEDVKLPITEDGVKAIFTVLGLNDLLMNSPMAIPRRNGSRAENVEFVQKAYGQMILAAKKYGDGNLESGSKSFIYAIDKFLNELLFNYFNEVIGDWEKYLRIMNSPELAHGGIDNSQVRMRETIQEMRKANKDGDFQRIRDLEIDLI